MPTAKTVWTYLLLGLLSLATWWTAGLLAPDEEAAPQKVPGAVDYYSKNIRRTLMGDDGRPKQLLDGASLTHYTEGDRTEIERPVMTLYAEDGPPWVIHAESARLTGNSDTILLSGEVTIQRDDPQKGRTLTILTRNARVDPGRNYAETDEFVQVLSPPDTLTGTGARVNFGRDIRVTILSKVRRKHEVR